MRHFFFFFAIFFAAFSLMLYFSPLPYACYAADAASLQCSYADTMPYGAAAYAIHAEPPLPRRLPRLPADATMPLALR